MPESTSRISGIRTIGVPVTDQDKAVDFYVGTLGFEKRMDMPLPQLGSRWIEVAPAGAAVSLALVRANDGLPSGGESGVRFTTGDAAALHADLTAAGVEVGELLNWPGVPPMFTFRDQDGNGLEIVQDPADQ
ncbi:VOC family protein [Pseudonocardia xinjiangensis]|uniref:Glyoxalase n=1 Tax=Pseudonocardia xinjiangensis TaxID=75289 RepID=A0ABX1RGT9_9PSEU|nr:VOC family protein [Pseudonocardia xinjiangensis]NMH79026.1 glyoxalase [Pseudonocardia xinjiangensis]